MLLKNKSILLFIIISYQVFFNPIAECGTEGNNTSTKELQDLVRTLTQEQRNEVVRLVFGPEIGWPPGFENVPEVPEPPQGRWHALGIFIAGTIVLFVISQYGDTIVSNLFNITRDIATQSIDTLMNAAVSAARQVTPEDITRLLNNPRFATTTSRAILEILNPRPN